MLRDLTNIRRALSLTQSEMAAKLGITRNYLALIETGRRNVPVHVQAKIETLLQRNPAGPVDTLVVREDPASYKCNVPAGCDLPARLDQMQAEIQSLKGKIDTLLGLLGGPLRQSMGINENNKDPSTRAG